MEGRLKTSEQVIDGSHVMSACLSRVESGFSYKYKSKRGLNLMVLATENGVPLSMGV